ncbi:hypothetical protein [Nonomuraea sp. NPDC049784]|uniref:hypothetical protein n=1 Tax=Nonomuraea sp. NPDC049784 TaxID=3154361 RepID=UPI0033EF091F
MAEPYSTPYKSPTITKWVAAGTANPRFQLSSPASVADVLRSSGRSMDPEVYRQSYINFDKAIDFLVKTAGKHKVLSEILLIAAGQMHGERDPLDPDEPAKWGHDEEKFVTVLIPGNTIEAAVRLPTKAVGYTDYLPAAVYVSDYSTTKIDPEVHFASTLMHEYTHVVIERIYRNVSVPWKNGDESAAAAGKDRYNALVSAFLSIKEIPDGRWGIHNEDLRKLLVTLSNDWAGFTHSRRYPESVPYLVEALFLATRFGEQPESIVKTAFGEAIMDVFTKYVVPDINTAAQKVRKAGAVT